MIGHLEAPLCLGIQFPSAQLDMELSHRPTSNDNLVTLPGPGGSSGLVEFIVKWAFAGHAFAVEFSLKSKLHV